MTTKTDNLTAKPTETKTVIVQPDGTEKVATEFLGAAKLFTSPPCEIGIAGGVTINLGNYSSARVDVSIKIPCAHAEIEQVFAYGQAWVDNKVTEISSKIIASTGGTKK